MKPTIDRICGADSREEAQEIFEDRMDFWHKNGRTQIAHNIWQSIRDDLDPDEIYLFLKESGYFDQDEE